jgi:DNA-binding response OmpR family regulator
MTRSPAPKLLLIDDEPALAAYLAEAARLSDFDPITAKDDSDFKALLVSERPQMVAIDLGMPGMDGVELLRFLAEEGFAAPVLIISGFDRRVLESAFRLGEALGLQMVGPLEKPTRLDDIERILKALRPQLVP